MDIESIPTDGIINSKLELTEVNTSGLTAAKLHTAYNTGTDNLVPKHSDTAHIKGKLKLIPFSSKSMKAMGFNIGIVGNVNGEDFEGKFVCNCTHNVLKVIVMSLPLVSVLLSLF